MRVFSILILLFFVLSFSWRTDHSFDQDLGRHIKVGEIIVQTKSIPLINLFSYTYPNFPFINSHWLFEVLVYLGQQTIGLQAILFLKVIILLLTVFLTLKIIAKNQYLLLPVSFIFLHLLRERLELRPEILSFLFTASTLYILDKFEKTKTKLVFALPLIQLIWVNSHIYFIVGIAMQSIFILHFAYHYLRFHLRGVESNSTNRVRRGGKLKLLGIIFTLSVITSLINPSGLKGFLNPFLYNTNYGYTIVENQTMFLLESINFRDPNFLFAKLSSLIIILSILFGFYKKHLTIKNLGLSCFGLTLALMNVRSFPYLILISLPSVLENFGNFKFSILPKAMAIITSLLLIYESFLYLNGDYYKYSNSDKKPVLEYKESAKGALSFVLENKLSEPVFNNFDIGSYITYRGYPNYSVFVDGRPGEYPKEFFQGIYIPAQSDQNKFRELDKKIDFKTIIFSHTDQTPWGKNFLSFITHDPNWQTVYLDDFIIVLVKKDEVSKRNLEILDLSKISVNSYKFDNYMSYIRMSIFLLNAQSFESARLFTQKALVIFPESPIGNLIMASSIPQNGDLTNYAIASNYLKKSKSNIWW